MRITVIGCGYLGATHAACMAELGYEVLGVEIDDTKRAALTRGEVPFYEPGLPELLSKHVESGRLRFTDSYEEAAAFGELHFLCVGTPQSADGLGADIAYVDAAMDTALGIIAAHAGKVDGIKISLLDKDKEIAMRRRLPAGVRMYTGDDFNYAELIAGDGFGTEPTHGKSDALLGIFDAIAPAASAALGELAQGNLERFHAILGPTVPLSRHIFRAPTRFYKTGVVFMAWLNGHQKHFAMVGGQQSTRSLPHFAELFRLADAANLLEQPELAVKRMNTLLALHGVA